MKKSIRTFALLSTLTLASAPMMMAEPMGTNPRPFVASPTMAAIAYTVLAYFGL